MRKERVEGSIQGCPVQLQWYEGRYLLISKSIHHNFSRIASDIFGENIILNFHYFSDNDMYHTIALMIEPS
jgi:hypothetical protein